ncbi:MAG TPA: protease inhibitor I42 family protein [Polyangiaceae bacterium]|nr:protease inhibitor I42 family protein [Polyangiaceae bacterium]
MKPALVGAFACLAGTLVGCKTSPETAPPGASAPVATTSPLPGSAAPSASDAAPPAASGTHTYPASTTSISAAVGETFVVALPANITVPMKWRIEPAPDAKVLGVGDEKYVAEPPADCPTCTGYGGTRLFAFTAAGAGKATLHFALRPLTDPHGAAQKEVTIAVEVQ